jgi:glycosyltransferase involved in cell wall biosynthesis
MKVMLAFPVYNPTEIGSLNEIIKYFHAKFCLGNRKESLQVVLINDGSTETISEELSKIAEQFECCTHLVKHLNNLGKGAAIKSAINFGLSRSLNSNSKLDAIVFADSDGQHSVTDIERVLNHARLNPAEFVIGVRVKPDSGGVPLKSKIGRSIVEQIFNIQTQMKLSDSQSGLRSIPSELFKLATNLPENRFDFENRFILEMLKRQIPITEIPISTIYEAGNRGTKFRPIVDSARVLFTFIRAGSVALFAAVIDYAIFALLMNYGFEIYWSALFSKCASGLFYLVLISDFVFIEARSKLRIKKYPKVFVLQVVNIVVEPNLVVMLSGVMESTILSKVCVDTGIFFLNFLILRNILTKIESKQS